MFELLFTKGSPFPNRLATHSMGEFSGVTAPSVIFGGFMRALLSSLLFSLVALAIPLGAHAITIDNLALDKTKPVGQQTVIQSDRQIVTSSGPVNVTSSTISNAAQVIGGTRFVQVQVAGGFNVTSAIDGGFLSHSQDASTKGASFLVWDGNPAAGIQAAGLGGVDLLEDGASGFKLVIEAYDFPTAQPLKITFTVYDASDPTGTKKVSVGSLSLNGGISSTQTMIIPFTSFTKLDTAQSPADLTNVGAISMLIDGSQSPSHDVVLSFIGTDGKCEHIPQGGLVLDQCGVCNGNNTSCADCDGVPNGTKLPGLYCSTGEFGVCGDGTLIGKFPTCSCSRTNPPATEICDGIDNDCDGLIDEGSPTTGPLADACGVCKGNGSSCADCAGTPNGTAVEDVCGVCNGDGSSCQTCTIGDQEEIRRELDGGAKEQEALVVRGIAFLRSTPKGKTQTKFISSTIQQAHRLQVRNWNLAYSLPRFVSSCQQPNQQCVTASNVSILSEYRQHNAELRDLALNVFKRLAKIRKGKLTARERKVFGRIEAQFNKNLALSQTVPETQTACSN